MSLLPSLTGQEIIRVLKRQGFNVARIKGSHHILIHPDGRRTVVPVHAGETIGSGLVLQILRDCQIIKDEFKELL